METALPLNESLSEDGPSSSIAEFDASQFKIVDTFFCSFKNKPKRISFDLQQEFKEHRIQLDKKIKLAIDALGTRKLSSAEA